MNRQRKTDAEAREDASSTLSLTLTNLLPAPCPAHLQCVPIIGSAIVSPPPPPGGSFADHSVQPMFISHGTTWEADKASERRELSAANPLAARHPLQEKELSAVPWRTARH